MASTSTGAENPSAQSTVSLRVMSQLPEPNSTILFPSLPSATTVGELKTQIRDRIEFKPSLTDQRLIHRGRLLVKETDSLRDIFGADEIEKNQPFTLHLVVRDHNSNNASNPTPPPVSRTPPVAPGSAIDAMRRQQEALINAQSVPQMQRQPQSQTQRSTTPASNGHQGAAQPGLANGQQQAHLHGQLPQMLPNGMPLFPPNFPFGPNVGLNAHPGGVTVVHTPQGPRIIAPGQNINEQIPNLGGGAPPFGTAIGPHMNQPPQFLPQGHAMHMPHAPQPQDQSRNSSRIPVSSRSASPATTGQDQAQNGQASDRGQSSMWRRDGVGQNGERWSVTVNSNFPVPAAIQNFGHPPMFPRQMPTASQPQSNMPADTHNLLSSGTLQQHQGLLQALECLIRCRDQVYGIERHFLQETNAIRIRSLRFVAEFVAGNLIATIQTRNRAQEQVNQAIRTGSAAEETLQALGLTSDGLRSLEREFRDVVGRLRNNIDSVLNVPSQAGAEGTSDPVNEHVSGYLLSSPNGQQAVLFDSQGGLAPSSAIQSGQHNETSANIAETMNQILQGAGRRERDRRGNGRENRADHAAHENPGAVDEAPRNRQLALDNPPHNPHGNGDFGILVPIFRALWILVRVAGFIWFFSSGSMTRRSWLLCLSAVIVFAAQAAVVRTQLDRVRQYFEDILAGPDAERQGQDQAARENRNAQANVDAAGQPRQRRQEPTPEATAERLLREARQTQQGRLQEVFRAIERAVVLFVGSLYPGVGERQVQARERFLREQERREAQAALPAPAEDAANTNNATNSSDPAGENTAGGNTATSTEAGGDSSTPAHHESAPSEADGGVGSSTSADPTSGSTGEMRQRQVDSRSS